MMLIGKIPIFINSELTQLAVGWERMDSRFERCGRRKTAILIDEYPVVHNGRNNNAKKRS